MREIDLLQRSRAVENADPSSELGILGAAGLASVAVALGIVYLVTSVTRIIPKGVWTNTFY